MSELDESATEFVDTVLAAFNAPYPNPTQGPAVYWVSQWQWDLMMASLARDGLPATGDHLNQMMSRVAGQDAVIQVVGA